MYKPSALVPIHPNFSPNMVKHGFSGPCLVNLTMMDGNCMSMPWYTVVQNTKIQIFFTV